MEFIVNKMKKNVFASIPKTMQAAANIPTFCLPLEVIIKKKNSIFRKSFKTQSKHLMDQKNPTENCSSLSISLLDRKIRLCQEKKTTKCDSMHSNTENTGINCLKDSKMRP
jgi:hypothetical protein